MISIALPLIVRPPARQSAGGRGRLKEGIRLGGEREERPFERGAVAGDSGQRLTPYRSGGGGRSRRGAFLRVAIGVNHGGVERVSRGGHPRRRQRAVTLPVERINRDGLRTMNGRREGTAHLPLNGAVGGANADAGWPCWDNAASGACTCAILRVPVAVFDGLAG